MVWPLRGAISVETDARGLREEVERPSFSRL